MILLDGLQVLTRWIFINSAKASLLIMLIFAVRWIARDRLTARWQHALWIILILRLLLPAGFESDFSLYNLFNRPNAAADAQGLVFPQTLLVETAFFSDKPSNPETNGKRIPADLFSAIWITGVFAFALFTLIGNLKCRIRIGKRKPVTEARLLGAFARCMKGMKIRRPVGCAKLDAVQIPMLYGWLRPVILLPSSQIEKWTPDQVNHILCHELAHHKRHDILIAHITAVLQVLHWFNPLMWLAFYRIRLDREIACDAIALNHLGRDQAGSYGSTMLSLLENISRESLLPMTVGVVESRKNLKRRLTSIAGGKRSGWMWTVIGLALALVIGYSALTESGKAGKKRQVLILEDIRNTGKGIDPGPWMRSDSTGKRMVGHLKTDIHRSVQFAGGKVEFKRQDGELIAYDADTLTITGFPLPGDSTKVLKIVCKNVHVDRLGDQGWVFEADQLTVDTVSAGFPAETKHETRDIRVRITKESIFLNDEAVDLSDLRMKMQEMADRIRVLDKTDSMHSRAGQPLLPGKKHSLSFEQVFGDPAIHLRVDEDVPMGMVDTIQNLMTEIFRKPGRMSGRSSPPDSLDSKTQKARERWEKSESNPESLRTFESGMFKKIQRPVLICFRENGKWGYRDRSGEVVIEPRFEMARDVTEEITPVRQDGKWGYIGRRGNWIVEPVFEEALDLWEDRAMVKQGGEWGFVDEQGRVVIRPQFDDVFPFSDGLAVVRQGKKTGVIDKAGHFALNLDYDQVYSFFNGLAAVEKDGRWGFIDRQGRLVIPCVYEQADYFSEGLAAVRKDGKFGYIDTRNGFVIPPRFEEAGHFSEGLAVVRTDTPKYGFIDKTGRIVIQAKYDAVLMPFEEGRANVVIFENPERGIEGRRFWIDRTGEVIPSREEKSLKNRGIKSDGLKQSGYSVILDPGHGGKDPGGIAPDGLREKDLNLKISRRLAETLQENGVQIRWTRMDDSFLQLKDRADMFNSSGVDLALSLHVGINGNPEVNGIASYYHGEDDKDDLGLSRALNEYLAGNGRMAVHPPVKAGFTILRKAKIPAVLIEPGYMSNPNDLRALSDPEFINECCRRISGAVLFSLENQAGG